MTHDPNKTESLASKCNQPPLFVFEGFVIRPFDGWHLWMEHPSGEGTTIRKAEFLGTLIKLFERNF
jgi:hypothetical protein